MRLSRPDTSVDELRRDQVHCGRTAVRLRFTRGGVNRRGGYDSAVRTDRDPRLFLRCMTDKGYLLDPNGYPIRLMRV